MLEATKTSSRKFSVRYYLLHEDISPLVELETVREIPISANLSVRVYRPVFYTESRWEPITTALDYLASKASYGAIVVYNKCLHHTMWHQTPEKLLSTSWNVHYVSGLQVALRLDNLLFVGVCGDIEAQIACDHDTCEYCEWCRRRMSRKSRLYVTRQEQEDHQYYYRVLKSIAEAHRDRKIIVISYCSAIIKYNESFRKFLDEYGDRVPLIICGCGGAQEDDIEYSGKTLILNLAPWYIEFEQLRLFSRARLAMVELDDRAEVVNLILEDIPPPIKKLSLDEVVKTIREKLSLTDLADKELRHLLTKYGDKLLDDFLSLIRMWSRYGVPWTVVFVLYELGIRSPDQLLQADERLIREVERICTYKNPILKYHVRRVWNNVLREREAQPCLLAPLPYRDLSEVIIFDAEYYVKPEKLVLVGFYDPSNGSVHQFFYYELDKLRQFVARNANKLFIHYGGADRAVLEMYLGDLSINTWNILFFIRTNVVIPRSFTNKLSSVHAALCGFKDDPWWRQNFYDVTPFEKLFLCRMILDAGAGENERREYMKRLAEINKADLIALGEVVKKLLELPVKRAG